MEIFEKLLLFLTVDAQVNQTICVPQKFLINGLVKILYVFLKRILLFIIIFLEQLKTLYEKNKWINIKKRMIRVVKRREIFFSKKLCEN